MILPIHVSLVSSQPQSNKQSQNRSVKRQEKVPEDTLLFSPVSGPGIPFAAVYDTQDRQSECSTRPIFLYPWVSDQDQTGTERPWDTAQ